MATIKLNCLMVGATTTDSLTAKLEWSDTVDTLKDEIIAKLKWRGKVKSRDEIKDLLLYKVHLSCDGIAPDPSRSLSSLDRGMDSLKRVFGSQPESDFVHIIFKIVFNSDQNPLPQSTFQVRRGLPVAPSPSASFVRTPSSSGYVRRDHSIPPITPPESSGTTSYHEKPLFFNKHLKNIERYFLWIRAHARVGDPHCGDHQSGKMIRHLSEGRLSVLSADPSNDADNLGNPTWLEANLGDNIDRPAATVMDCSALDGLYSKWTGEDSEALTNQAPDVTWDQVNWNKYWKYSNIGTWHTAIDERGLPLVWQETFSRTGLENISAVRGFSPPAQRLFTVDSVESMTDLAHTVFTKKYPEHSALWRFTDAIKRESYGTELDPVLHMYPAGTVLFPERRSGGYGAAIKIQTGKILFVYLEIPNSCTDSELERVVQCTKAEQWQHLPESVSWRYNEIAAGEEMIISPGTLHGILALDYSVITIQAFLNASAIKQTEMSRRLDAIFPNRGHCLNIYQIDIVVFSWAVICLGDSGERQSDHDLVLALFRMSYFWDMYHAVHYPLEDIPEPHEDFQALLEFAGASPPKPRLAKKRRGRKADATEGSIIKFNESHFYRPSQDYIVKCARALGNFDEKTASDTVFALWHVLRIVAVEMCIESDVFRSRRNTKRQRDAPDPKPTYSIPLGPLSIYRGQTAVCVELESSDDDMDSEG